MNTSERLLITNQLRHINESVSCLWEGLVPVYSNTTKTIKIAYDTYDYNFTAIINEELWNSININDKCFLITHVILKEVLSHRSRMNFLSDKKCASISSNIVINHKIISDFNIIFSEMSILKNLCFTYNSIENEYQKYVSTEDTMEFIFTVILHIAGKNIKPRKDLIIIDYDQTDTTTEEESIKPHEEKNDDKSESLVIESENNNDNHQIKNKSNNHIIKLGDEEIASDHKRYVSLSKELMDKLSEILSDNISRRMIEKDFPKGSDITNEDQYLELAISDLLKLTKLDENKEDVLDCGISSSTVSDSARKKYQIKTSNTKRLKLKKIIQRKMLISDDYDDEDQFFYRDYFLNSLDKSIRIPSVKNIGDNKRNKKNIILYVDSSGSCQGFAKSFAEKVYSLKMGEVKLRVFSFDDKVSEVNFSGRKINIKTTYGGTSFSAIVRHSNKLISSGEIDKHSLFLVLTDGIDNSFKSNQKSEIKSKRQWYWFITGETGIKSIGGDCGNIMRLSDFI